MPEGHTLHRLAAALDATFAGREVRFSSPQGRFAEEAALLDGGVVAGAEAWGKHLLVEVDGVEGTDGGARWVHVHLGLYGRFDVHPALPAVPEPVGQVRLRMVADPGRGAGGAGGFAVADLRGATACALQGPAERRALLDRLGPDPLRPDPDGAERERSWQRVRRSAAPVGTLLMDQSVLAGVGNVYRAEVLHRHRLHPLRPGRSLQRRTWYAVWDDLVDLMAEGVRTGRIDTVRPEHTPEAMGRPPRRDDHGGEVYVYRRAGQPCLVCGAPVRTAELGGRNLFWCGRCQRAPRTARPSAP